MKQAAFVLSITLILLSLTAASFAQQGNGKRVLETVQGVVTSFDWVSDTICVNDMVFHVPDGTDVRKGENTVPLSDINVGDPVIMTYYRDNAGLATVASIIVQYSGDF